ncbi:RTA1-domain-containing protein [Coniochaeta sp. PMI_546]|nr:RTA1-domain-containing protein [Coniochaeta sp. PMI_546]
MDFSEQNAAAVGIDSNSTAAPSNTPFKFYHYDPTTAGAVIFILLFVGTTCLHLLQLFRTRCWIVIPLIVGGVLEAIGYGGRFALGRESPEWTLGPYIIQAILLLVAPALFAATIYMELGRIILRVDGEAHALIRKKWLTKIFVCGDVLSFVLQVGGGGYQASGSLSALETGAHIIIAGLFVQLVFFGVFIVIAVSFNVALRRAPTARSSRLVPWEKHMMALYVASGLIVVRSVFRAVEYLQGFDGYLLRHEAYLYIFDALLMFLVMVLFNVIHPSEVMAVVNAEKDFGYGFELGGVSHSHRRLPSDMR